MTDDQVVATEAITAENLAFWNEVVCSTTAGLNLAITYRLEITNADGTGAKRLGEVTQVASLGVGSQTIAIPVSTPVVFNNQRLKLTISSIAGVSVNLQMESTSIEATDFVGTP